MNVLYLIKTESLLPMSIKVKHFRTLKFYYRKQNIIFQKTKNTRHKQATV